LLERFAAGFSETEGNTVRTIYLIHTRDTDKHVEPFSASDAVILAFPLYTDAMPGIVKTFIEALEPLCDRPDAPRFGFIVQSGFPEPVHSRAVQRYLEKLARRLGCEYLGAAVKGGVEGIQVMPPRMTQKLFNTFYQLGYEFGRTGRFSPALLNKLAPRERMSPLRLALFRVMSGIGLANYYWNQQLKKNSAFEKRFDRPHSVPVRRTSA
jgi:NAD(P)H-dependent FMN reductase